jgi:hypothetical protein
MKTKERGNGTIHSSNDLIAEQDTKNFFYLYNSTLNPNGPIGMIDIKQKEIEWLNTSGSYYKQSDLKAIIQFLDELYEYYKHR